jgi:hypothetical protein
VRRRSESVVIPAQLAATVLGVAGVVAVVVLMAIAAAGKRRVRLTNEVERRLAEILDAFKSTATAARSREELLDARLTRLEQALDILAIETERIGEGQRHVSKLLSRETPDENDKRR